MAALVPRLRDAWGSARDAASSRFMRFIYEPLAESNATGEMTGIGGAAMPQATSTDAPGRSFFDPSSIYTSGYALGVAIMVRLLFVYWTITAVILRNARHSLQCSLPRLNR